MQPDLLTRLERPGGSGILYSDATLSERRNLALHLAALRAQGHAVVADEVISLSTNNGDLRVLHYLSCVKCRELAKCKEDLRNG